MKLWSVLPRLLAAALLCASTAILIWPSTPRAQSGGIFVDVTKPGAQDLPLALPSPIGGAPEAREIWEVIRRDLEISGYFRIIDPNAFIEPASAGVEPGEFDYADWEVPGAVILAKTNISSSGGEVRAEAWIYDVPGTRKLGAKAFTSETESARRLGHRIANEIIYRVTGEYGIFNTRLAAVNKVSGNKELYILDPDGGGQIPITRNGSINLQPSWSNDGSSLLFTSYRANNPDLYVADLIRGKTRRISARPGINTGGAWSPNGSAVALTLSKNGDSEIYTIDPDSGAELARLTHSSGIDVSPSWSPDGSEIAFVSERAGAPQIYIMSARGGDARRVTFQGSHNTDPAWSPRGDRIAFVSRDGNFDIFTVRPDSKGILRVTQGEGDNEDPTWAPNGRYLAFSSTRTGGSHVWISSADGRHQVQITEGRGTWSNPAWSPTVSW